MKHLFNHSLIFLFLFAAPGSHIFPQQAPPAGLDSLQFLAGSWAGSGTGEPGQGIGEFSFSFDLQGKVLVRKSFAEYPATSERPAFRHDDMTIIYRESGGPTKAIYFDNEGHVINYEVKFSDDRLSLIFLSDYTASSPRFRLTYTMINETSLKIKFEIAPPGKPNEFTSYLEAEAKKK